MGTRPSKKGAGGAAEPAGGAGAARALARRKQPSKRAPGARLLRADPGPVTLEELLVGFQRSLARATRSSVETARADWQVGMGQRSLYVVDGIGVTLQGGLVMARDAQGRVQAVSVDLGHTEGAGSAAIEFRVSARPIEAMNGENVVLADLDPLGLQRPTHRLRLTLIGALAPGEAAVKPLREPPVQPLKSMAPGGGAAAVVVADKSRTYAPLPHRPVTLYVVGGDSAQAEAFALQTNAIGTLDVEIDSTRNRLLSGTRSATFTTLDLNTRDDDFFVWATCSPEQSPGIEGRLTSNVLQFNVQRATALPPTEA